MPKRRLYLLGGNTAQREANVHFSRAAGGKNAKIALLIVYREGWEAFLPRYTKHWLNQGVPERNISVIIPNNEGMLDADAAAQQLAAATGIFIGGGHSETYYAHYAKQPFKQLLKDKYATGVPVAGNSAGALLMPETVLLSPRDTDNQQAWSGPGLGLLHNQLISVHFSQWQDEQHLIAGLEQLQVPYGYGIDEDACLYFENEQPTAVFGTEQVKRIEKETL
ncbi:Type 1 glutamine amidotransferase-like domain-containing protein [Terribacillus halophilus]|jgi:cyanophycinase|uniref:Type 1 glutamine amidotransferase-like domain-containing protein n=1 Tax=Terribacillus halophilus TaxID=361279 RepID=UPI000984A40F|nr:Type 1 glutamine amidotransferase-like domain-containing protein [Terribacillus halophilus]